jgi:hypothetical protein
MNDPDNSLKEIVKKVREADGEIEHPDVSSRYIGYLASLLEENTLLDDDLKHLLDLYAELHSGNYLNKSRPSTSSPLIIGLQKLVASKAKDSLPTMVGKTFICHQILEETFYRLVKASHFLIDLRMGIYRVQHPDLDKENLYGLCKELEKCVDFPSRNKLIQEAHCINGIRNHIAHALLTVISTRNLRKQARQYLAGFRKINVILDECFDEVYFTIKPFRKWSDMFEDGILEQLTTVLDEESIQYDNREIFAGKKGLSL